MLEKLHCLEFWGVRPSMSQWMCSDTNLPIALQKGNRQRNWRLADWSRKPPEDVTSPEMSCSVLLCPFTNKYWQLVLFVCLLLCLSSCSSRSLCDNKTSALLFSQGWWNRDDHDRPWKSESGRILNESPIKFEVWLSLFFFNSLLDFMTVLLYALRSHNCVE